jgi:hypothetical protein
MKRSQRKGGQNCAGMKRSQRKVDKIIRLWREGDKLSRNEFDHK